MDKLNFIGTIASIQPRIRLLRSFDEASHIYPGYAIRIGGELAGLDSKEEMDSSNNFFQLVEIIVDN